MDVVPAVALAVFTVSAALVLYAYAGYPVTVWLLAKTVGRRPGPAPRGDDLPTLSVLVAAYNEESIIRERILNALALDYPADRLEIAIATDGCSDRTAEIVAQFADRGVRLLAYPVRRGKATVLNESIPQLRGEVVLLSDANTFTDADAARRLVRWFDDPSVGVVCGKLVLTDPATGKNADGMYWKYETFLKKCEGRIGALLGANGGIYAVRRAVFTPIPADTIVDDFVLPLEARLRTGCRIAYDPTAVAREETAKDVGAEFHRRARIGAGGFQSLGRLWRLLDPRQGWIAFTFWSHKVLRWTCPFFLVALVASNLILAGDSVFLTLLIAQGCFYLMSAVMAVVPVRPRVLKPLLLTTMFTGMNLALLLGFWRWLAGTQSGAWRRTVRTEAA
jgi:cellulose synthase/poly-beta-1,6-N-acetylglucosamine synthase-like glycosyltransferase